jgi:hypothetical protein
MSSCG